MRLEVIPVRRAVPVEPVVGPVGVLTPAGIGVLAALLRKRGLAGGHGGGGDDGDDSLGSGPLRPARI